MATFSRARPAFGSVHHRRVASGVAGAIAGHVHAVGSAELLKDNGHGARSAIGVVGQQLAAAQATLNGAELNPQQRAARKKALIGMRTQLENLEES